MIANHDLEAIRVLFDDLGRAIGAGEPGLLEELLERDSRAFAPRTPVIAGRAMILEELRRWFLCWRHDLRLDCAEIVAESEWGFCSGTFGLRSVCPDSHKAHYTDGKFLAVVHRGTDGTWRIHRICYNSNLPYSSRDDELTHGAMP